MTHFPPRFSSTPVHRMSLAPVGLPSHSPKSSSVAEYQATSPERDRLTRRSRISVTVALNFGSIQVSKSFTYLFHPAISISELVQMMYRSSSWAIVLSCNARSLVKAQQIESRRSEEHTSELQSRPH